MPLLLVASLLGFAAGLRTFTGPAVLWLARHGGAWAYALGVLALAEYVVDLHPKAGARTLPLGLTARLVSGGFCGWAVTSASDTSVIWGIVVGACAAIIGAYLGLAARLKAADAVGRVPAGLIEDLLAIGIAVAAVR